MRLTPRRRCGTVGAMRGLATIAVALSLGLFADAPCLALSQINTDGAASAEDVQPESLPQPMR